MDPNSLTSTQKAELIDNVKEQIAVATVQELLVKITDKCFAKCINKPGTSLDSSETKCLNYCVDRFFDSYNWIIDSTKNVHDKDDDSGTDHRCDCSQSSDLVS
ncbi:Mitochondrial import inner membrane translocase subunit Tim13 [Sarcoptes scabiei]|uniref:Mitochondrial import inner membrane translocase subunit n=1 Tax=Sarcoptes scabiei TaxID=52283 RepID=A0A834RCH1_SARSC|nr:Mitochondrial import inner membrane translocase subunit Tim13 [Sarcoptes scabiei]